MISRAFFPLLIGLILCSAASAEHSPLLPRPQQIRYGDGRLRIAGLSIRVANAPAPEDLFAARELAAALSERSHTRIRVRRTNNHGTEIVLHRTGPVAPLAIPGETPGPNSRESYSIAITPAGATVRAPSSAGLFYAIQTLRQLIQGKGAAASLPEVEIHDWPALAHRGTMIDMSHGPLPTEEEIKRQLDFLARWKGNQYYLYSEASIELHGYPLLNPDGRFSQDEIRRIVQYARERHIDVVPNFDLFGHLHDLFRVEKYSDLSDLPHGVEFDPRKPQVKALLADWIDQLAELFPSPFVNIGFDETFQIEIAAREGAQASPVELFIKQLSDVTHLFEQHGKRVLAWEDIMVRYPEIISRLPPGLIAVAWYYDPQPDPEYKKWLAPLIEHHVPHFVQPAVSSWEQISPDFDKSFENIDTLLAAGRRSGAQGFINSVWTDDAQMLMRASWPGIAYGAAAPWQSGAMDRKDFFSAYAQIRYGPALATDAAAALKNLSVAETQLQLVAGESTMTTLWFDPFFLAYLQKFSGGSEHLHQERLAAEDAQAAIQRALEKGGDRLTLQSLLISSRLLDYAGEKFQTPPELIDLWRRLGPKRPAAERWWNDWESQVTYQDHSHVVDLMDAIENLKPLYQAEWLAEYTPYRLGSALGRWDAEYDYWRRVQQRLQQFSDGTHEGDALPPLAQVVAEK